MADTATKEKNTTVRTDDILATKDYDQFTLLPGNRQIQDGHVKHLMASMLMNGNLTPEFPITVNENLEIIDGQHRLEACKRLDYTISYRVVPNLTVAAVRAVNQAARNWTWIDFATSYVNLGKKDYKEMLELHEEYNLGSQALLRYCTQVVGADSRLMQEFKNGEFKIKNLEVTKQLLGQYQELIDVIGQDTVPPTAFAQAIYYLLVHPDYEQETMVTKLGQLGHTIPRYTGMGDYLRELERIYNFHRPEQSKVRFF